MPKLNISAGNRDPIHHIKREKGSLRNHPTTLWPQDRNAYIWLENIKPRGKYQGENGREAISEGLGPI